MQNIKKPVGVFIRIMENMLRELKIRNHNILQFFTDTIFHRNKMAQVVRGFPDITWCISDRREFRSELARFGFSQNTEELLVGIIGKNGEYYQGPVAEMMNLKLLTDFAEDFRKSRGMIVYDCYKLLC